MQLHKYILTFGAIAALSLAGCTDEFTPVPENNDLSLPIRFDGEIAQEAVTRANDNGFANGDVIGIYVVDYQGIEPGKLLTKGNHGDNVRHTFNEATSSWTSAFDLYWKDKHTAIDVYGYYPYGAPEDVNNYSFTVSTDQSRTYSDGRIGEYEASDFLWGKAAGVQPTSNTVRLPLQHRMANARVILQEGTGFADGEWSELEKQVLVTNTILSASIDLASGTVTPSASQTQSNSDASRSITPSMRGDEWRAIVVPQTIGSGTTLFSITLGGIPYKFTKAENFEYVSGHMSNFTIRVDKKEQTGSFTLKLVGESITSWENDLVSHDASLKEYVIVNATPGALKDSIAAAKKNPATIKNLKITGSINITDFTFMKSSMTALSALNLKEVKIASGSYKDIFGNTKTSAEDEIPADAFKSKTTITRIILPDRLKAIGDWAFGYCSSLAGSIIIPEGVTKIGTGAFSMCSALTGTLTLPQSLQSIGTSAFSACAFNSELNLPSNLTSIADAAFSECKNLYGNLNLPSNLETLGANAFYNCINLSGSLTIPQKLKQINAQTFGYCSFDGNLILHDGITTIGDMAFFACKFVGELTLPKNLEVIGANSFRNNQFCGKLLLPSTVASIGTSAFENNNRLSDILEIPSQTTTISSRAFAGCSGLQGLILSENLDNIGTSAFENCLSIGSIRCKNTRPAVVGTGAFYGVPKDNFTVEVPASAVTDYQTARGWCDFKQFATHHELVCRPAVACALSSSHTDDLILNAEGDWEVQSKPDWCSLSQMSGSNKTTIKLTINRFDNTTGSREGDIVFRLKELEYTTKCHVTQHGYRYEENQCVALQQASKGKNGGINIIFIGDGYNSKNIADGTYLNDMNTAMSYFFALEPYTTYREYFNVYAPIALSLEEGAGSVNTVVYNKFGTSFTQGSGLKCDTENVFNYALLAPTVNAANLYQTLIVLVPNTTEYGGICHMWPDGSAIAICPKSTVAYPYDTRGIIQHEAGGHGFGKLGDEYIYHNAFIDNCNCNDCKHTLDFTNYKKLGWYDNLELTGKIHKVGWSHLIFDNRYSSIVDIYEGGYMHSRGVFRSEQNSCMNNNIPYYSTISRESIVKRIKQYAGENYNFEEFVALDKRGAATRARTASTANGYSNAAAQQHAPVLHKGSPLKNTRKSSKKTK